MRRWWITRIVGALFAGLVLSLLVAWGLVFAPRLTQSARFLLVPRGGMLGSLNHETWAINTWNALGFERVHLERLSGTTQASPGPNDLERYHPDLARACEAFALALSRRADTTHSRNDVRMRIRERAGWPMRAFQASVDVAAPRLGTAQRTLSNPMGGWLAQDVSLGLPPFKPLLIPWRPLFPGFAVNVGSLGTPIFLFLTLSPRSRRSWRRLRGLCPACGYDLRGQTFAGCPECGAGRT